MTPYFMWVIAAPEGGHCTFLMRPTRTKCIKGFNDWHPDMTWEKARRKGWRCIKMSVRPAISLKPKKP